MHRFSATGMPSILVFDPADAERWSLLADELRDTDLEVALTNDRAVAEDLCEKGADALLLAADGLDPHATADLTAALCRRHHHVAVLVARGGLGSDDLLELFTVGAADWLVGAPSKDEARARLLGAIERRRTETELRRGYAAFGSLFYDAVSPMAMARPDGRFLDANAAFLDLVDYTLGEIRRLDVEALTHQEDTAGLDRFGELARGERARYRITQRFVGKRGNVVWANLNAVRYVEPVSGDVRILADLHDMTPEVESHQALARARNRYEVLFEQAPSSLLLLDLESMRFTAVNRAAVALFGYRREELLARGLAGLWSGVGEAAAIERLLRGGETIGPTRQRLRCGDGRTIETELTIAGFDDGGDATRLVVIRDVSALHQLENDLERSRAVIAGQQGPSSLAHELDRLVATNVERCDALLAALPPDGEARTRIEAVRESSLEMVELIGTYFGGDRPGAAAPQPLDLGDAVVRAKRMVEVLAGGGVELVVHAGGEALPIWFDPAELDQILFNLTANARDAMGGRGRLTIAAGRLASEDDPRGAFARLSVSDSGVGIAPQLRDEIFKPFFTTKPAGVGTGLGLATVDRLVRRSGGRVGVDSEPGRGATFHVDLPLDASRVEHGAAAALPAGEGGSTILLVDDDEAVLTLVHEMLESGGHRVVAASGGRQALEAARRYPGGIDLLIVDATLDDLPAAALIERLGAERPQLAALVISGYLDDVLKARGMLGRDTPFLSKPFSAAELLAAVEVAAVTRPVS